MIVAAAILLVLVIISFLRLGVVGIYDDDGFLLNAYIGPFKIKILPGKETQKDKNKSKEKSKDKLREGAVKAGKLETLKKQLPSLKKALSRLKRKLRINELTVYYMAAGSDAAATALQFGGVSAGYGVILPFFENNFKLGKRDLRASVNFEVSEPYIYVKAKLSLAVWEVFYIASGLFVSILKNSRTKAKIRKAV